MHNEARTKQENLLSLLYLLSFVKFNLSKRSRSGRSREKGSAPMTNEQLAAFIKQGAKAASKTKQMLLLLSKLSKANQAVNVNVNDIIPPISPKGNEPESGNKFTAYLSYPFRTAVQELTGMRTQKQKQEPLNSCASLDMPLNKDEPEKLTLADTIADDNAVNAPERVELEDDYRVLHEAVDRLKEPQNRVINAYYFENKSLKDIGAEMRISPERVRQYKAKGLRCLRCSPLLKQLYRENLRHKQLRRLQWCQTRPDKHLYIAELEERYAKVLQFTT